MRILLTSIGSRGDLQPMAALGRALQRRGHEAVLAGPPNFAAWAIGLGLPFQPFGIDFLSIIEGQRDIARGPIHAIRVMMAIVRDQIAIQFDEQRALIPTFDRVIATGINLAAVSIAESAHVPCEFAAFAPGIVPSADHPPALLPWPAMLPRATYRPAWWLLETIFQRTLGPELTRQRATLGLSPCRSFRGTYLGEHILYATDPILSEVPNTVAALQTGAWMMGSDAPLPTEVQRFLDEGPPPVYIGFGSLPDVAPEKTTRLFVNAVRAVGARAIISRGWAGFAAEPLPEGFLAIGDVAHEQLFPRVAAVVHHGGSGTTHAAARAGVPQLVVPHGADQFYWGGRVERLGLGPASLRKTRLTGDSFTSRLRELLTTAAFRENAQRLGERLRTVDGLAAAVRHLEESHPPRDRAAA